LPKEIPMPESATANIIPFPSPTVAPVQTESAPVEASPAEARLSRALIGLNNAIIAQRAAMTAWKSALGDLRTVTGRLGSSLRSYHDSLGQLDSRATALRSEAVKLEAWADDALDKKV
jgi:hypothetical protein